MGSLWLSSRPDHHNHLDRLTDAIVSVFFDANLVLKQKAFFDFVNCVFEGLDLPTCKVGLA